MRRERWLTDLTTFQNAIDCGLFDEEQLQQQVNMREKERILKSHPFAITRLSNGRWQTYYYDKIRNKKCEIKLSSREKVIDRLYALYKDQQPHLDLAFSSLYKDLIGCKAAMAKILGSVWKSNPYTNWDQTEGNAISRENIDALCQKALQSGHDANSSMTVDDMAIYLEKVKYVKSKHDKAITRLTKGPRKGKWQTYVGTNPRRQIMRNSEKELVEYLYSYYKEYGDNIRTLEQVYNEYIAYYSADRNWSHNTVNDYNSKYHLIVTDDFAHKRIDEIDELSLRIAIRSAIENKAPKYSSAKRAVSLMKNLFRYALQKGYVKVDVAAGLDSNNYKKLCSQKEKQEEEKSFSAKDLTALEMDYKQNPSNPRALMHAFAAQTGMRAGELSALQRNDVDLASGYIHIHQQQVKDGNLYYNVPWTKDERGLSRGGRRFPITKQMYDILERAGITDSEATGPVFHDEDGKPIKKDSYQQYLNRRCQQLGLNITNNHAFRNALNAKLTDKGMSPIDRATLLGHSVETNLRHYTHKDRRRLSDLSKYFDNR